MSAVETLKNTVFLIGFGADETRQVREDFETYPFPDWRLEVLEPGSTPPMGLLAGQAILVIGCGWGMPAGHSEAMWLLRIFACGCPWVAVTSPNGHPTQEVCEGAGASAYLAGEVSPSRLRESIWHNAVPFAGKLPVQPLTCERMLRYFAVMRADLILKFSAENGRTGFLTLKAGQPIHATVLDGPEGPAALKEILNWGKGKVLGQPLVEDLRPNLPDRPEAWLKLLRGSGVAQLAPQRAVPGSREACELVIRDLPEVNLCVLVDLRSARVIAHVSRMNAEGDLDRSLVIAAMELIRHKYQVVDHTPRSELADEILLLGRDEWCCMTRLSHLGYALIVVASGQALLGLAQQVICAATAEIERRSGMTVEGPGTEVVS